MAKIGHFGVSNLTFQTTQLTFNPVYLAEIFILNTKQTIQTNHIKPQPDVETRHGTSLRTGIIRRIKNPLPYGCRARDNDKEL